MKIQIIAIIVWTVIVPIVWLGRKKIIAFLKKIRGSR